MTKHNYLCLITNYVRKKKGAMVFEVKSKEEKMQDKTWKSPTNIKSKMKKPSMSWLLTKVFFSF